MSRFVHIDGDVLVYESSFGAQRNRYTVYVLGGETRAFNNAKDRDAYLKESGLKDKPESYTVEKHLDVLDEGIALTICQNKLNALLLKLDASSYHVYLTGKGNYRDEIATLAPYKGNRADVEKPVHFAACRQWFESHPHASVTTGQEADDAIGIAARFHGDKHVIASIDKDLRLLLGPHYEWHTDKRFTINQDSSDRWFWMQMLMGDKADNIPGIKGIGDVKAAKHLEGHTSREARANKVGALYQAQYGENWKSWMNEVGMLLWIRNEEGQLWNFDDYVAGRYDGKAA